MPPVRRGVARPVGTCQERFRQPRRAAFERRYKSEMSAPAAKHDLELLAALSHATNFSVGCYCENESRCHRSVLRDLLIENGAKVE
jgi:uncharacterized protein YeaO (DUF488 family)